MHPQPFEVMNDGKGDTVSLLPITFIIRSSMKERQTEMGKTPSYGGTPKMEVRVFENAQFGQVRTAQSDDAKIWFCLTDVAKELNLRHAEHLHALLKDRGVMYRQSGHWFVTAKYSERGYTKTRTHAYVRSDGSQGTNSITVWTESGRLFLHDLLTVKA